MSVLLDKAKRYNQAANNLHAKKLFCPEAHCRYYSCVQWMLHIAQSCSLNVNYDSTSVHKEFIKKIGEDILTQTRDTDKQYQFGKQIGKLRMFRVKADYKEDLLSKQEADETRQLEKTVKEILDSIYEIT